MKPRRRRDAEDFERLLFSAPSQFNLHWPSKLRRFLEEGGDVLEEAAGASSVEHAVIEAQGEVGFGDGHKLAFRFVPVRGDTAGTHTEDEGLLGQRDRRGPFEAEGA